MKSCAEQYVQVRAPAAKNTTRSQPTRASALFFLSCKRPVSEEAASQRNICNVTLHVRYILNAIIRFQMHHDRVCSLYIIICIIYLDIL